MPAARVVRTAVGAGIDVALFVHVDGVGDVPVAGSAMSVVIAAAVYCGLVVFGFGIGVGAGIVVRVTYLVCFLNCSSRTSPALP